jgi:hypothetical protein
MAPENGRIPITAASDREAIEWALLTSGNVLPPQARLTRIQNTLHLERFYASEALRPEIEADGRLRIVGDWAPIAFGAHGNLLPDRVYD